jgi:hypothetical protein
MPAAVAATITAPEMIRLGKNHQAPVEIKIAGPEGGPGGRDPRWLTQTRARAGGGTGAKLQFARSTTQLTHFGPGPHGK